MSKKKKKWLKFWRPDQEDALARARLFRTVAPTSTSMGVPATSEASFAPGIGTTPTAILPPPFRWAKDSALCADLTIGGELFLSLCKWQAEHPAEISGYGAEEGGRVTRLYLTALGSTGGVDSEADLLAQAMAMALEDGLAINLQWHTHYAMTPFFSATDDSAQREYVERLPRGEMVFVCFDQLRAVTRRLAWDAAGVRSNEGRVRVDETWLPQGGWSAAWKGVKKDAIELESSEGFVPDWEQRWDGYLAGLG